MAIDPRKFIISCPEKEKPTDKFSAFDAISNVSGLEIQNKAFDRLRTLVKIGNTAQKNTVVGDGVAWVFDKMGLNYELTNSSILQFSPSVANTAIGSAKQIAEKIKQGNFQLEDIPQYLADFTNLEKLIKGLYTDPKEVNQAIEVCQSTHYASDLIGYAPKFKFMFVVEFVLNGEYHPTFLANGNRKTAAFCQTFERPNPTFEYEMVNMYNFRTRVLTKVTYPSATMTFLDDSQNHVMEFFQQYMREMSPLYRLEDPSDFENNGMNFSSNARSSSMKQPSIAPHKDIFREIRVYHLWQSGRYFNLYRYFNPKIEEIQFDPYDMADGQTTTIGCQFAYDSLNVQTGLYFGAHGEFVDGLKEASALGQSQLRFTGEDYGSPSTVDDLYEESYQDEAISALEDRAEDALGGYGSNVTDSIKANIPSVDDVDFGF